MSERKSDKEWLLERYYTLARTMKELDELVYEQDEEGGELDGICDQLDRVVCALHNYTVKLREEKA